MWQPSACPPISRRLADGIRFAQVNSCGLAESTRNTGGVMFQDGSVQEYTFELGASTAETETGGIRVNMIPREGGNTPKGVFFINYSGPRLATSNVTDDLRAIGI